MHEIAFGRWGMKNICVVVYFWTGSVVKEKMCVCYLSGCCRHLFNLLERWILKAGSLLKCLFTLRQFITDQKDGSAWAAVPGAAHEERGLPQGFGRGDKMPRGRLGGKEGFPRASGTRETDPGDGGVRHSYRWALPREPSQLLKVLRSTIDALFCTKCYLHRWKW